ncbi:MAG: hydroxyacid dehydrogenase [Thermaerobacter sp.]|nr:hydroxyacid dehydrogenase [Thermaerobacter sp.]
MRRASDNHGMGQNRLPPPWAGTEDARREIRRRRAVRNTKLVVLDDDPTGAQTLSDVAVLTDWQSDNLQQAFEDPGDLFYVLTNTRAHSPDEAREIDEDVVAALQAAAHRTGVTFDLVSRGDSTLRGHYPLEVDVLARVMQVLTGVPYDAHLLVPAYLEEGRFTYHGWHYVRKGAQLVPVNETEYAQDHVFGYRSADLRNWVEEKTAGRIAARDCLVIPLEEVRAGPAVVARRLAAARGNVPVVVDAMSYEDLDVLSLAVLEAQARGQRLLFRTASSFVKSYSGQPPTSGWIDAVPVPASLQGRGALVVVGSHVASTTRQLAHALEAVALKHVELDVQRLLSDGDRAPAVREAALAVNEGLGQGEHVVVSTSRAPVRGRERTDTLRIGQAVADALVEVVQAVVTPPRLIIIKGGITAREISTRALNIRRAHVLGQISSGISVWVGQPGSRWAGMAYIVFPGNVGDERALLDLLHRTLVDP